MPDGEIIRRVLIFISSPSDLAEERAAVKRVVAKINSLSAIKRAYILEPLLYEEEVLPEQGDAAQLIVNRYMQVEDCYVVICMMWGRMGMPFVHPQTGQEFQSGTEYEFLTTYESNRTKGKPYLLLYRKMLPPPIADYDQLAKVEQFFQQFDTPKPKFKGLYKNFNDTGDFEEMLFRHLDKLIDKYPPSEVQLLPMEPPPAPDYSINVDATEIKNSFFVSGQGNVVNVNLKRKKKK